MREKTTSLKVQQGWNYIAMDLNEVYDYTYVTLYHKSEQASTASKLATPPTYSYYDKYETFFEGTYSEGTRALVLGCKNYLDYSSLIADSPYGLCMRGWI